MTISKLGKKALLLLIPALLLTGCSKDEDAIVTMKGHSFNTEKFTNELNLTKALHMINYPYIETTDKELAEITTQHITLLEAFTAEGEKLNLNPDNETLENLFNSTIESLSSTNGLLDLYESYGYTDEALKEYLYKERTAYNYFQYLCDSISISGADAKAYYEENKSEYETADADHILFKTYTTDENGNTIEMSDKEKESVKKKAEKVLKKVEAGEDFNELAKKYSEEPGAEETGGQLGTFGRGDMVKEFDAAVFSLEPGKTSKLVETVYGYHIIKLNSKSFNNYSNIEDQVKDDLLYDILLDKINEIEKKYKIEVNSTNLEEALKNLKEVTLPDSLNNTTEEDSTESTNTSDSEKDNTKEDSTENTNSSDSKKDTEETKSNKDN